MTRLTFAIALLSFSLTTPGLAGERSPATTIKTLDTMVVGADLSGPAIWEFTRGGKRVFILGTYTPIPDELRFDDAGIQSRIAQSGVVISSPGLVVGDNIGLFRGLTLWPSIHRSKFNPDRQTLQDILPAQTFEAWRRAKGEFLGDGASADRLRPMYAAYELFKGATKRSRLNTSSVTAPLIERAARTRGVPWIDARYRLSINDPKEATRRFTVSRSDDIQCLEQTLDQLAPFLRKASAAGDAWGQGDLQRFTALGRPDKLMRSCWAQLTNHAIGAQQGIGDIDLQVDATWLAAVEHSLAAHDTVFTALPLRELMDSTGAAAALLRAGFQGAPPPGRRASDEAP